MRLATSEHGADHGHVRREPRAAAWFYRTASMKSAATRRTAPSLGLDAWATSRHQPTKAAASSGMRVTRYASPPTKEGPRSAVSSARTTLEGSIAPEGQAAGPVTSAPDIARRAASRSRMSRIARKVSGTTLPGGIAKGWTVTTPPASVAPADPARPNARRRRGIRPLHGRPAPELECYSDLRAFARGLLPKRDNESGPDVDRALSRHEGYRVGTSPAACVGAQPCDDSIQICGLTHPPGRLQAGVAARPDRHAFGRSWRPATIAAPGAVAVSGPH